MKKILAITIALLTVTAVANAQSRALGVRVAGGGELSYQHNVGTNFAEFDLGWWMHDGFYVSGIYDFMVYDDGGFGFYAGPGATVGFYNDGDKSGMNLGVGGQLGLEYKFGIPLQLSLDWRPMFRFMYGGFGWNSFALGIRYLF